MLAVQLINFKVLFKDFKEKVDLKNVIEVLGKSINSVMLPEICTVLKLIFTLPATNTQSEMVFSSLTCVKTPIKSWMSQD